MKTIKVLSIFTLVFLSFTLNAQQLRKCSTPEEDSKVYENNPNLYLQRQEFKENYKKHIQRLKSQGSLKNGEVVYKIPIVFHLMHNYGTNSGSVYQDFLTNQQKYINAVDEINFQYRNSDSLSIQPPFDQISHPMNIEFVLAKKDPNGNLTSGIIPHYNPETESAGQSIKTGTQWDNYRYLNIWIVNGIASGAGGWSQTPPTQDNIDGIVMLNVQLNDLAHECGHWLGLEHPWGPSNDNDLATNCNVDDGIDDTPNTRGQTSCNLTRNSCSGSPMPFLDIYNNVLWPSASGEIHDNTQNIMDYAFCSKENFTEGQKVFMRDILANMTSNGRNTIGGVANGIAAGICDTCGPYVLPAQAYFVAQIKNRSVCAGTSVSFKDYSYSNTPDKWHWDFGDGDTSNVQNPSHTYSTPGNYDVELTVTNSAGTTDFTSTIYVGATSGGLVAPFYENFENSDFPNTTDSLKEWTIINDGSIKWSHTQNASYTGFGSLSLALKSIASDKVYQIISPTIDFSSATCNDLSFKYAYARRYTTNSDQLNVYVSKDCGQNWQTVLQKPSSALKTTDTLHTNTFIPSIDEWVKEEISLASFAGRDHILIKIELVTGNGNYFYIDDIDVGCNASTGVNETQKFDISIYPNPFENDATLKLNLLENKNLNIQLYDVLGKSIYSTHIDFVKGNHTLKLSELTSINKGIYFITIGDEQNSITKKLIKY